MKRRKIHRLSIKWNVLLTLESRKRSGSALRLLLESRRFWENEISFSGNSSALADKRNTVIQTHVELVRVSSTMLRRTIFSWKIQFVSRGKSKAPMTQLAFVLKRKYFISDSFAFRVILTLEIFEKYFDCHKNYRSLTLVRPQSFS